MPPPDLALQSFERSFPVIRLRGLPFNCSDQDVHSFLEGLDPIDVVFVRKGGRLSGEAYVVLPGPLQVEVAVQSKNRQNMGRRYVEVFRATKQEYYGAVASFVMDGHSDASQASTAHNLDKTAMGQPGGNAGASGAPHGGMAGGAGGFVGGGGVVGSEHTGVLKLRGIPFAATKMDIISFFADSNIVPPLPVLHTDSIHIVVGADGRASGAAFVEFPSPVDAKRAMLKDRQLMGSRYVELFPSSREEAAKAATKS